MMYIRIMLIVRYSVIDFELTVDDVNIATIVVLCKYVAPFAMTL